MEKELNKISIERVCKALCDCMNIQSPIYAKIKCNLTAEEDNLNILMEYVNSVIKEASIDKLLIYNPDAIGQWVYEKCPKIFEPIKNSSELIVNMRSVYPPKTPVCFASMYTGAVPNVHGITKYEKRPLDIDTFFDMAILAGKKVCIVTIANQSMDILFRDKGVDIYTLKKDREVITLAVDLIKNSDYDIICVYNQEYDDALHRSYPLSCWAKRALKHYNASYEMLCNAVSESWIDYNALVGCLTDHGSHSKWYGLGTHGKNISKDMNICHFYKVFPKSSDNELND